jgi:predicted HTH transcriptional regulator
MEWEKLSNILKAGESEQTEFKESAFLRDNEEIAAQLASFANRKGGEIPIGVRDDAKLEGAKISRDKAQLHILNIAQDKVSPPVELFFQFLASDAGDVLIIEVAKRKGIPHAIVTCSNHEIKERCYYIRTSSRRRLVSDTALKWPFEHSEEPYLEYPFYIWFQYFRDNLQIPVTLDVAPPRYEQGSGGSLSFLEKLTNLDI